MTLNKERDQDYDNGFLESLRLQHYDTNIPEVTQTLVNIEASGRSFDSRIWESMAVGYLVLQLADVLKILDSSNINW